MQTQIIKAVESSIEAISGLFEKEATQFFTENDLVCCFHRILHNELSILDQTMAPQNGKKLRNLIHCEYPTPYRCDMGGNRFEVKTENDLTPNGKKFRRGRFDVVVLNPSFVGKHPYSAIKGQNYADFHEFVEPFLDATDPIVIYGIEFVFCRDEIKPSRGVKWEKAATEFVAKVHQDTEKLRAGLNTNGFMKKAMMLAFVKGTTGKVMDLIGQSLQGIPEIRLLMAP